jgi:hypothetical protein
MFESLKAHGYQVEYVSHAEAILGVDFPTAAEELERALVKATIPIEEIIAGGGGETKGTQRLRRALSELGWKKGIFTVQKIINGVAKESQTHEIDHVKAFPNGCVIALEIEWNNKDPFYDRDLENFKRLHADGAISLGIIVTRGRSLHDNMQHLVRRFCDERSINGFEDLAQWGYIPTPKQRSFITHQTARAVRQISFRESFVGKFCKDKFGEATTHWAKLDLRIRRGVGNPCPLVFIGLPDSMITFHEGRAALIEITAADHENDQEADDGTAA